MRKMLDIRQYLMEKPLCRTPIVRIGMTSGFFYASAVLQQILMHVEIQFLHHFNDFGVYPALAHP